MTGEELFDEVARLKSLDETWWRMANWEREAYERLARAGEGKLVHELAWELLQPRVVLEKREPSEELRAAAERVTARKGKWSLSEREAHLLAEEIVEAADSDPKPVMERGLKE